MNFSKYLVCCTSVLPMKKIRIVNIQKNKSVGQSIVWSVGGNLLSEFGHFEGHGGRSTLAMTALTTYTAHTHKEEEKGKNAGKPQ